MQYQKYFHEDEVAIVKAFRIVMVAVVYIVLLLFIMALAFGVRAYIVVGWSMQPTIDYKSIVFICNDKETYEIGDILSYKFSTMVNTHRVIDIEYNTPFIPESGIKTYVLQGDNPSLETKEHIIPSRVLGRVIQFDEFVFTIPNVGYTILFLQEHIVPLLLCIIGAYIYFYMTPREKDYMTNIKN